jgi:hypothetical protein
MVIDNMWEQGKISETVYQYIQLCYLLPTHYKIIFYKLHQADGLRCIALLQACLEVAVHAPPLVLTKSRNFVHNGWFEFWNSRDTSPEHTVFHESPQEKIWYSKFWRPSRPSDVAETTNTGNTVLHVPTLHCS